MAGNDPNHGVPILATTVLDPQVVALIRTVRTLVFPLVQMYVETSPSQLEKKDGELNTWEEEVLWRALHKLLAEVAAAGGQSGAVTPNQGEYPKVSLLHLMSGLK